MTPAAALTQAAMDVTPAYAADEETPGGTPPASEETVETLTGNTNIPDNQDSDGEGAGWAVDSVVLPTVTGAFTYDGGLQAPNAAETVITAVWTYYDEAEGGTPKTQKYRVSPDLIMASYVVKGGDTTAVDPIDAREYTATYKVNEGGDSSAEVKAAAAAINGKLARNTQDFTIDPFTVTVTAPESAQLGVATGDSIAKLFTVTGVGGKVLDLGTGKDYSVVVKTAADGALPSGPINTPGDVKATVTMIGTNYKIDEDGTKDYMVPVKAVGTYEASFKNVETTPGSKEYNLEATNGGKSAVVAWNKVPVTMKGYVDAGVEVSSGGSVVTGTPAPYTLSYTDKAGTPLAGFPAVPGEYGVAVTMANAEKPFATLPFTVKADLGQDVKYTVGGYDTSAGPVQLLWDETLKDDPAKRDAYVIEQIKEGFSAALDDTSKTPVSVDDLLFEVTTTVNSPNGGTGVVTVKPASPTGLYVGNYTIKYGYGKVMPTMGLVRASEPFNGNTGYALNGLVKKTNYVNPSTGAPAEFTDFEVSASYVDEDGKTQTTTSNISNVGDYKIIISGKNGYAGSQTFDFKITERTVTKDEVSWQGNKGGVLKYNDKSKTWDATFNGTAVKPEPAISVKLASGTATLYDADKLTEAEIKAGKTADYKISYSNNTNVGTATATVTFMGNYAGTVELPYQIVGADLSKLSGASATAQSQLAEGFPANPTAADVLNPVVSYNVVEDGKQKTVVLDPEDYVIKSVTKGATSATGETAYTFVVEGQGNYSGTLEGTFNTVPSSKDISELWTVDVAEGNYFYQMGEPVKAGVVVKTKPAAGAATGTPVSQTVSGQKTPNYQVTYKNNVDAGTATVIVSGDGQYAGSIEKTFEIAPLQISQESAANVDLSQDSFVYAPGIEAKPEVVMGTSEITPVNEGYDGGAVKLKEIVDDIAVTYANNTAAGTAQAIISGKEGGNVSGSYAVDFEIAQADIADATVEAASVVPGAPVEDSVVVKLGDDVLAAGTDYTVAAEGALPGTVAATVTGTGNYTGEVKKDVAVLYDVAGLSYKVSSGTYNGQSQTPVVTASYKDAAGKAVEVPASALNVAAGSYVNAGKYDIKVTGNNAAGWGGETTVSYTIAPATVTAKPQVSYDAAGLPVVTVPGLTSSDFDYKADAATKTITVTYKGNYKGTATVAYAPAAKPVAPDQPAAGKTGWVGSGNDWAYYEGGKQVKDQWKLIGGEWYHFEKSGKMTNTKWFQDKDGEWYLLNQSHKGSYGAMLTGWQKVDGGWYYMGKSGDMQSGWLKDGGEWYLLNTKHDGTFGKMLTGWQQDADGKWYYMDASGAMASSAWVGRYWVNGSGVWTATR
ncbi:hypothetical protein GMI69_02355 [Eggerthellaceae bacterium zg-887]|uniref:N-acetylmuramoyl-L-alanine amidase family protein n=1 Tax=Xiamenia xianingshaonis TaxID=2682776 RepID=UPI00140C640B|nr:hypothetical protein [Xiamenia xianingshaonis]NHM15515.1 hypothetical protein [Xiamenia xianingshaonis]